MGPDATGAIAALALLAALVLAVGWVVWDARTRAAARRPVSMTVLGVTIEQPTTWAVLCIVAFVVAFPLYLAARRAG